ncbi:hypothetical protein ACIGEZ_24085 [Streptomyces sp. NPDC085481]|uniref:hypothetical protein n=1 Tax=Streptomyces sp. NPDC085481 TaxID=3365727 RepID=UPI0037CFCD74
MTQPDPSAVRIDAALPPDLLRAAVEALAHGIARPTLPGRDADAGISADYAERMKRDLTEGEGRLLESIAGTRERGLALCRTGRIHDGGSLVAHAREMLTRGKTSREAFVLADSFLRAAEGFVYFSSGRTDAAVSSMLLALDRCRELRDSWNYPVEGRRIHIACNTERVRVGAGHGQASSVALAQLLNLIDTADRRFWPHPHLEYASEPDLLDDEARWELTDQALAVLPRLDLEALDQVVAAFPWPNADATSPWAARARCFTEALHADASGDPETFLTSCAAFFPSGPQRLPRAFGSLSKRLLKVIG